MLEEEAVMPEISLGVVSLLLIPTLLYCSKTKTAQKLKKKLKKNRTSMVDL